MKITTKFQPINEPTEAGDITIAFECLSLFEDNKDNKSFHDYATAKGITLGELDFLCIMQHLKSIEILEHNLERGLTYSINTTPSIWNKSGLFDRYINPAIQRLPGNIKIILEISESTGFEEVQDISQVLAFLRGNIHFKLAIDDEFSARNPAILTYLIRHSPLVMQVLVWCKMDYKIFQDIFGVIANMPDLLKDTIEKSPICNIKIKRVFEGIESGAMRKYLLRQWPYQNIAPLLQGYYVSCTIDGWENQLESITEGNKIKGYTLI